jgi:hypothetical protein
MKRDDLAPLTAATCPPENDAEALRRATKFAAPTLLGLTDTVWTSLAQLRKALRKSGHELGVTDLVSDGGRKRAVRLHVRKKGIAYSILAIENGSFCRCEIIRTETIPERLSSLGGLIDHVMFRKEQERRFPQSN